MTSGMRHNWVQAVLKNVKTSLTPDITSSLPEQKTQQQTQQPDSESTSRLQAHNTSSWAGDSHQQQKEQESKLQSEREQRSADKNAASSLLPAFSAPSPISPPHQVEEGQGASCLQCPLLAGTTQTGVTSCVGAGNDNSSSAAVLSDDEEHSKIQILSEQIKTIPQCEGQQISVNTTCECMKDKETLPCEQQTVQLVTELEQTQKELSQLQELNKNLQDELEQEREIHSRERIHPEKDLSNFCLSSEQASALQQLQKINHDLYTELEAKKRSQEEAREAELLRRVDVLAQQAQLLVTGDATALAQPHLEHDRKWLPEQQMEQEYYVASLKSQLSISEEQRREAESCLTQLQQELQGYHKLQREADHLQKQLQEMKTQFHANEEAQAQKEVCLQKHLTLLQASQDRERRSLAACLAQAEQHSQDLQERLDMAEQKVESMNTWTRELEEAQQQLQEELARTVSVVQELQEEKEQLDRHCQELQNQLSEADGEMSRLQSRLKTEETHYYNIEHSYEKVYEELQLALGKAQQRESETQNIQEGYQKLLDRKEEELSEVLLKMEVLGNSLEETEMKLNEVLKVCTCASFQLKDELSELAHHNERQQQTIEPLTVNDSRSKSVDSGQLFNNSNIIDVVQVNSSISHNHARTRSHSIDPSYQYTVTAGDEPEMFMSVIQLLETKLYVTEEKLRDITQRLKEHQSHHSCQDPHLCSQLTQSQATAQHLSLLLHSQAKQSQRFAWATENRCRMLVGRFQVALNIIQACRKRLQGTPIDISHIDKQLATAAACLQQGQEVAEKQQNESHNASRGENKILSGEAESNISTKSTHTNTLSSGDDMDSAGKCLMRDLFVVQKMVSVLQSQHGTGQLSLVPREGEGDVAQKYQTIISQRIALNTERRTHSGRAECDSDEPLESSIRTACAEAELIYVAIKCQQLYESEVNNQETDHQRKDLTDISPPELVPYEERVQAEGRGLEEIAQPVEKLQSSDKTVEAEKEPNWLERLISRLQRRVKFLCRLCQEISDECSIDHDEENDSVVDLNWVHEHAKLFYLSDRLYLDLEQQLQQNEVLQKRPQALCKEQDVTLMNEQEAFNRTLGQLQEDNSMLREELERAEQKIISVENGNQRLLEDIQKSEHYHEEHVQKLETECQEKIRELQQIHEEEMKHLHRYYTKSCVSKERQTKPCAEGPSFSESHSTTPEMAAKEAKTKEDLRSQMVEGDAGALREGYQKDLEQRQGFIAMEEMHRKLVGDLQQQHQTEVAALLKEKDQLLREETAATMAAIVAMRRAHKKDLEKCRQSQHSRESADVTQLHIEYEKEIQLLHKELEVLSVQYTQKCLENSQLSQELQDERKSLMLYQKEHQELKRKQRQTDEMSHLHRSLNGEQLHVAPQINDFYEMEKNVP
uniref:cilia- and flagella-associated protein 58 n=1 Tax=Monopterus albus TaxID=43700 RepID=UPI0009B3956D|nr:cilia- and flagella-associated protein 58-like [Monopterus albus]